MCRKKRLVEDLIYLPRRFVALYDRFGITRLPVTLPLGYGKVGLFCRAAGVVCSPYSSSSPASRDAWDRAVSVARLPSGATFCMQIP